jgi:hypothetical protein
MNHIDTYLEIDLDELEVYGGPGSGNHGHAGIPGHHGGSAKEGTKPTKKPEPKKSPEPKPEKQEREWESVDLELQDKWINDDSLDIQYKLAENIPEYLYHVTDANAVDSIMKEGLVGGKGGGIDAVGDTGRRVYLAGRAEDILEGFGFSIKNPVILKVSTKDLNLRLDPEFYFDMPESDVIGALDDDYMFLYSKQSIKPSNIKEVISKEDFYKGLTTHGGEGSGNFGHCGIPGHQGGSGDCNGTVEEPEEEKKELTEEERARYKNYADVINSGDKKAMKKLYDTDPEFHDMCDMIAIYTQGGYKNIRSAMIQLEEGQPIGYFYGEKFIQTDEISSFIPVLSDIKPMIKGMDVEHSTGSATRGLLALKQTIEESTTNFGDVYRGTNRWSLGYRDDSKKVPGFEYTEVGVPYDSPDYDKAYELWKDKAWGPEIDTSIKLPKEGSGYDYLGTMSYTTDKQIAYKFSLGRASGQGSVGAKEAPPQAVLYVIRNATGLNVKALSPWRQSEILVNGKHKVTKVLREEDKEVNVGSYYLKVQYYDTIELEQDKSKRKKSPVNHTNYKSEKKVHHNHNEYEDDDVRMIWPPEPWKQPEIKTNIVVLGGPGSGNRGHKGVKGQYGGSAPKGTPGPSKDDWPDYQGG